MSIFERNTHERELLLLSVPLMNMEELQALHDEVIEELIRLADDKGLEPDEE